MSEKDLSRDLAVLAFEKDELVGVAHVSKGNEGCYLEKLFVDPSHMGKGVGRALFEWSGSAARKLGSKTLIVEADPDAVPFYLAMNCKEAGTAPSGSIPGRALPRLTYDIDV